MWSQLWSILACKTPQFWAKATNSDSPSYFFFKSRHPEVTKWVSAFKKSMELVAFAPKLRCFTNQNGPKRGSHEDEFYVSSPERSQKRYQLID